MKAVINEKETPVKYPWIGQFLNSEKKIIIVGFIKPKTGCVLYSDSEYWKVFDNATLWDESTFTPFTGTITISND